MNAKERMLMNAGRVGYLLATLDIIKAHAKPYLNTDSIDLASCTLSEIIDLVDAAQNQMENME